MIGGSQVDRNLFDAVYNNNVDAVYKYIFDGANPCWVNEVGNQSIHAACHGGNVKIVQILLNAGVDPNALGMNNNTPTHYAAFHNHPEILSLLLDKGADPRTRNARGKAPRDMCNESTHQNVLELLNNWVIRRCTFLSSDPDATTAQLTLDKPPPKKLEARTRTVATRQSSARSVLDNQTEEAEQLLSALVLAPPTVEPPGVGAAASEASSQNTYKQDSHPKATHVGDSSEREYKGEAMFLGDIPSSSAGPARIIGAESPGRFGAESPGRFGAESPARLRTESPLRPGTGSPLFGSSSSTYSQTPPSSPSKRTAGYYIEIDGAMVYMDDSEALEDEATWQEDHAIVAEENLADHVKPPRVPLLDVDDLVGKMNKMDEEGVEDLEELEEDSHSDSLAPESGPSSPTSPLDVQDQKALAHTVIGDTFKPLLAVASKPLLEVASKTTQLWRALDKSMEYRYVAETMLVQLHKGEYGLGMQLENWNGKVKVCAVRGSGGVEPTEQDKIRNPAFACGVRSGDVVEVINGEQPTSMDDAIGKLQQSAGVVSMRLVRTQPRIYCKDINWETEDIKTAEELIHFVKFGNIKTADKRDCKQVLGHLKALQHTLQGPTSNTQQHQLQDAVHFHLQEQPAAGDPELNSLDTLIEFGSTSLCGSEEDSPHSAMNTISQLFSFPSGT